MPLCVRPHALRDGCPGSRQTSQIAAPDGARQNGAILTRLRRDGNTDIVLDKAVHDGHPHGSGRIGVVPASPLRHLPGRPLMGMLKEFKEFAVRGNVVDMAVGIIIGAAFGKIVTSLVNDVVMPPIGMLLGNVDFSDLSLNLREETADAPAVAVNYGMFINNVLDFLIVAFVIFLLIKQINRLKRDESIQPATTKNCPFCVSVIDIKARRCPNCTSELETPAPAL